jgi:hypothetical protein
MISDFCAKALQEIHNNGATMSVIDFGIAMWGESYSPKSSRLYLCRLQALSYIINENGFFLSKMGESKLARKNRNK